MSWSSGMTEPGIPQRPGTARACGRQAAQAVGGLGMLTPAGPAPGRRLRIHPGVPAIHSAVLA
jgi:hypothetical protein